MSNTPFGEQYVKFCTAGYQQNMLERLAKSFNGSKPAWLRNNVPQIITVDKVLGSTSV
jgi:hypothetical protein